MSNNLINTIQFFIKKFEGIDSRLWLKQNLNSRTLPNAHCALGHTGMRSFSDIRDKVYSAETRKLIALFKLANIHKITYINRGLHLHTFICEGYWLPYVWQVNDQIDGLAKDNILKVLYSLRDHYIKSNNINKEVKSETLGTCVTVS